MKNTEIGVAKLSKKAKLELDLERMGIEQELEQAVYADVADLLPFIKSLQETLNQQTNRE